ncbi:MAG TPA: glycosyltransferase, partial [Actinomycetota bacterium]|nr:glycosyltransferase [Actinomycetota bacterium]
KVLVTNPRREGYAGWDDGANRNRLLEAAAELDPEWVLELDADERIPADDAAALRRFVQDDAVPGFAYGFRVYRMIGDEQHYDRAGLWVYRLFAYEPGQRVPDVLQHFVPVPTSIPRSNWLRTTVRIQHLSSLTEERRRARYAKYVEADPERAYQPDYKHLLDEPGRVRAWKPRPSALPVLVDPLGKQRVNEFVLEDLDLDAPLLSAVVIARNDEERIERVLGSVVSQRCPFPFEVIAVVSGTDRTAEIVRDRFPEVTLIELEGAALPGRARNAGVEVARGDYVSFPGSHVELPPGSLAARLAAHERGYPMVTGETHNGTRTRSGWASYFLDHAVNLPGQPAGELVGPPAHCSYARDLLIEVGGFPTDMRAGEDTTVNLELARRGYVAYRSSDVKLVHHTRCSNPLRLIRHHFSRGRAYGKILLEGRVFRGAGARRKLTRHVIVYVRQRIKATTRNVRTADPEMWKTYRRVFPLVVTAVVAAWLGLLSKLLSTPLTGRDRKARGSSAPAPQGSMRGTARAGGSA